VLQGHGKDNITVLYKSGSPWNLILRLVYTNSFKIFTKAALLIKSGFESVPGTN